MNREDKNELLQRNLKVFSRKYPKCAEKFINRETQEDNMHIEAEQAYTGEPVLAAVKEERKLYLAGKYAPERPLRDWIEQQDRIYHGSVFFIIGMGNWLQIEAFLREVDKNVKVIIYEPSIAIFAKVMETYDVTEVLEHYEVAFVVEELNQKDLSDIFSLYIYRENMPITKTYISGNYLKLFPELVKERVEDLKKFFVDSLINWHTMIRYTDVVGENVFNNIAYFYHGYSVEQFAKILPDNVPVVIVSAGPSLNKNIGILKKAVGKCCIIATDTAIKPLLNRGIYPNFVAIVDGKKPALLFEHPGFSDVPLLTCVSVAKDVMNLHHGKKIFYLSGTVYENDVIKAINEERKEQLIIPYLATGGSVANTAFAFAYHIGAKNIILIGQDLAMTGNKTHADGTFMSKMDDIDVTSASYFEVEDIYGGKVLTRGDFDRYRKWFEDTIKTLDEAKTGVKVIDATEGGAKIHGAEIMTLNEAIEKFCIAECPMDGIMHDTPEMLSDRDKEVLLMYLSGAVSKLEDVRDKAKKGIKYYDKMLQLAKKKNLNSVKYIELYRKVKCINEFMDTDNIARFVTANLSEMENTMLATMNLLEEDEHDERIVIAQKGKLILETMLPMIDTLETIAKDTVMQYKGDDSILHAKYPNA